MSDFEYRTCRDSSVEHAGTGVNIDNGAMLIVLLDAGNQVAGMG